MNLFERWSAYLGELQARGRYRRLSPGQGIDFSSNDYLGYGKEPPPLPAGTDLARSGSASRLLCGQHEIWEELESALSAWHGAETALMFTSGYTANEGLLSTLLEPGDFIASDEFNHASIIDGCRLGRGERFVFRHNDLNHLESELREAARKRGPGRQMFIVTESLFGMEGDRAPLKELAELAGRFQAHLIVDEAHATGCFGPRGSGCVDEAGLRDRVLATVHTGGKALGLLGAYVCGPKPLRELFINRCRHFIFTTALPPLVGWWWLQTLARVQADHAGRKKLHDNAAFFRAELNRHGPAGSGSHYIVPILLGEDDRAVRAADRLREQGFDIRAIRPPSVPEGTARLRISIHADHDESTLARAAKAIAGV